METSTFISYLTKVILKRIQLVEECSLVSSRFSFIGSFLLKAIIVSAMKEAKSLFPDCDIRFEFQATKDRAPIG